MTPSIGRILHYVLTANDCEAIQQRRKPLGTFHEANWPEGAQAHVGNPVHEGLHVPLVVTAVWPNEYGEGTVGVNGQVLLDGNDSLWVTSARLQDDSLPPGVIGWCHWPERVEAIRPSDTVLA